MPTNIVVNAYYWFPVHSLLLPPPHPSDQTCAMGPFASQCPVVASTSSTYLRIRGAQFDAFTDRTGYIEIVILQYIQVPIPRTRSVVARASDSQQETIALESACALKQGILSHLLHLWMEMYMVVPSVKTDFVGDF